MAQLPASMRRKQRASAITSIHEKPPSTLDKAANWGGWALLIIATLISLMGLYALYKVMTDARVAQLNVVGTSHVEQQQIIAYVKPTIQNNYFTSDLEKIRDRTLEISWVDRVVVSRAWPNAIRIRIIPKHAIARWGTGRLLSDSGDVFNEAVSTKHQDLPLLHGPVSQSQLMMRRYNEINQLFQPFNIHLKELYLTERMTWFMQFDSGLRIIVDQDQTMSKLQRFQRLFAYDLKPVASQMMTADLRYRNGLSIQWKGQPPVSHGEFVVTKNESPVAGIGKKTP